MKHFFKTLTIACLWALSLTKEGHALDGRTWVSGVGDDANSCSRFAPCKTFAGALSKTAKCGEIDALDPGGFGAVTITQSVTIDGSATLAGVLASGTNAIVVDGAGIVVILRNLSLDGEGGCSTPAGLNGILFLKGAELIVENCKIFNFGGSGIDIQGPGKIVVSNTTINGCTTGILVETGALATSNISLDNVTLKENTNALDASAGIVDVSRSFITQNTGFAVLGRQPCAINCVNNLLTANGTAFQSNAGAVVRVSNNDIYNNGVAFANGGGTIATANNNREAGNGSSPGSPNASIQIQ